MIPRSLVLSAVVLVLQAGAAGAASLDKETCDKLKGELALLEGAGARGNMAKGPEWAKANLAADKLIEIKRLIEVDELLLFRCQGRQLVILPTEVELDPAAAEPKEDGTEATTKDGKAAPAGEKKAAPPAKKAAAPAAPPAKSTVGGEALGTLSKDAPPKKTEPAPAKAAKAKPKSDDAYRPPGAAPSADPPAKQPAPAGQSSTGQGSVPTR
jgi:hypothetical protein